MKDYLINLKVGDSIVYAGKEYKIVSKTQGFNLLDYHIFRLESKTSQICCLKASWSDTPMVEVIKANQTKAESEDQPWFVDEKEQSSLARALRAKIKGKNNGK